MFKAIVAAAGVLFLLSWAPTPAAAQKKPSCDAYCAAKVCATANSKNFACRNAWRTAIKRTPNNF
jgi:hypothetical protein